MQQVAGRTTQTQPNTPTLARSNLVVSALVILTLMSGWAIFLYLGIGSLASPKPPPNPISVKPHRDEDSKKITNEAATAAVKYEDAEQAFVLDLQRGELRTRMEKTRSSLEYAQSVTKQFDARIAALQTSDTGRRLAAPDAARKMRFLSSFPNRADFTKVQRVLSDAERFIIASRPPDTNFDQLVEELIVAETKLDSHNRRCETASQAVDQLLSESAVAQPNTLADAIEQLRQTDSLAEKVQVNARLVDQKSNHAAQIENETKQRAALKKELEQAKLRYDAVRQQSNNRIEASGRTMRQTQRDLSAQKAKAIAAMQAAYPSVRELLTPFTTPGYRQPGTSGRLEVTSGKQPLSYSGLLRMRALEDSKEGLTLLFQAVQPSNAFGKLNDRPLGDFPRNANFSDIDNAEVQKKLNMVQAFLRDHGEAMTEAGLLSP